MKSNCENYSKNLQGCICTYDACESKGICCECVRRHRVNRQIPGCFFSPKGEKTYERSYSAFRQDSKNGA